MVLKKTKDVAPVVEQAKKFVMPPEIAVTAPEPALIESNLEDRGEQQGFVEVQEGEAKTISKGPEKITTDTVTVVTPIIARDKEVVVIPMVTKYAYIGKTYYHLEKGVPLKVTRDAERVLRENGRIK